MTDLELLALVEKAQDGRKGDPGQPGIGIRDIRQPSLDRIVVELTNGETRTFTITVPERGEPGPSGPAGPRGEAGTAGARGPAGAAGRDGRDGTDGSDGASVDSAIVNASGELILGLTNGSVISVGRVVGPAGATGERGMTGLQGPAGRDGAQFLAGEHPPNDAEDGRDGDMWMDLSSPQMDVYGPKRGGAWGPRRFMAKQPPATQNIPGRSFLAGGGSGGSGGSGGAPPFEIFLGAGIETELSRINGSQGILIYKVRDASDNTAWSSGQLNMASTDLVDDGDFTVGAELIGVGGQPAFTFRLERQAGSADYLRIYATAAVNCWIKGRIVTSA